MGDGFAVDVSALRSDVARWTDWSSRLTAEDGGLASTLDVWAFSDQPGFEQVRADYIAKLGHLRREVSAGSRAMQAIADRLDEVASSYEEAEAQTEAIVERAGS